MVSCCACCDSASCSPATAAVEHAGQRVCAAGRVQSFDDRSDKLLSSALQARMESTQSVCGLRSLSPSRARQLTFPSSQMMAARMTTAAMTPPTVPPISLLLWEPPPPPLFKKGFLPVPVSWLPSPSDEVVLTRPMLVSSAVGLTTRMTPSLSVAPGLSAEVASAVGAKAGSEDAPYPAEVEAAAVPAPVASTSELAHVSILPLLPVAAG